MRKHAKKYEFPGLTGEEKAWLELTPGQRLLETSKLWRLYLSLGGSLDPEPDPQSPFYFKETSKEKSKENYWAKKKDRAYWAPLRKELEGLRHKSRILPD